MLLGIAQTPHSQGVSQQPSMSTSTLHLKRKASMAPMVVSEIRRSERLKGKQGVIKVAHVQERFACGAQLNRPL
jgi:hypothetical protein